MKEPMTKYLRQSKLG